MNHSSPSNANANSLLPPMGAHVSIAGGVATAPGRARRIGATAFQLFLKNASTWSAKPTSDEEAERFRRETAEGGFAPPVAHSAYLINLAATDPVTAGRSVAAMEDELVRAAQLAVLGVVVHPGAHKGAGDAEGIRLIAERINGIFGRLAANPALVILETTAGQGTALGWRFEQLAEMIDKVEDKGRVGVCLDTCHAFAAGYEMRTAEGVAAMLKEFDETVGLARLRAIHINDSKTKFGARRDRHEHIGQGLIGEAGFAALLRDPRLRRVPFILETPKDNDPEDDLMNLATLRRLALGG